MPYVKEPFRIGNTYRMVGGGEVTLVGYGSQRHVGTSYETVKCAEGNHRYSHPSREDMGRCTGTSLFGEPDPHNLIPLYAFVPDTVSESVSEIAVAPPTTGPHRYEVGDMVEIVRDRGLAEFSWPAGTLGRVVEIEASWARPDQDGDVQKLHAKPASGGDPRLFYTTEVKPHIPVSVQPVATPPEEPLFRRKLEL